MKKENSMPNAVLECIRSRRSIRKFKAEQIREDELATILEAATWAPSGSNSQTWLFTAIQNSAVLEKLAGVVRTAFLSWTPDDEYPAKHRAVTNASRESYNFFYHAPTLVIASNVPDYQNAMADCANAMQNLFLAAHSIGLGTCWINQLRWLRDVAPVRDFLAELGVPREHVICNAAAVGYPDHTPPAPARKEGTTRIIR